MKRILSIASILLFFYQAVFSQISAGGTPPGLKHCLKSEAIDPDELIDLPAVDTAGFIIEDQNDSLTHLKPYRFAYNHQVNYSINNSGKWKTLEDGSRLWKIRIRSHHAYSLMVFFSEFEIPEGAQLFMYDKNKEYVFGAYTAVNNNNEKILNTTPVPGDLVTVEYLVPANTTDMGLLTIGMIGHDYKNALKDGNFRRSKPCEVDINCDLGKDWQLEKRAVCRLVIPASDGYTYLCTGTLVNNTSQDGSPFVLSANHCIKDQYAASRTLFIFNYESPYCNGSDGSTAQSISTGTLKATTSHLDFSLTELSKDPPFSYYPYYAGWNINTIGITSVAAIHHPSGDVKKISTDNASPIASNFTSGGYDSSSHWMVFRWDNGATEGGSSGGALFDQKHRIIGTLSGGWSACGCTTNCADFYEMISHSWADYTESTSQLKYWLDPLGLGVKTLKGFDRYSGYYGTCDTLQNISPAETPVLLDYTGGGYWSGTNAENISRFAESFDFPDSTNITGLFLNVAKNTYLSYNSYIALYPPLDTNATYFQKYTLWNNYLSQNSYINIFVYDDSAGMPRKMLYTKKVIMNSLKENLVNFVSFIASVKVMGKTYFGFEILYTPSDEFAVFSSPKHDTGSKANTAYIYIADTCKSVKEVNDSLFGLSFDIRPVFCDSLPPGAFPSSKPKTKYLQGQAICYPNPSDGNFTVVVPDASNENIQIEIFNTSGCLVFRDHFKPWQNEYYGSLNADGIYIIRLSCSSWVATTKIIISR